MIPLKNILYSTRIKIEIAPEDCVQKPLMLFDLDTQYLYTGVYRHFVF